LLKRTEDAQAGKMASKNEVVIYTDGACIGNPGPGGYGAVLLAGEHRRELTGGYAETTNNRMELLAAIVGLEALEHPCDVTLYSDSRYLVDSMEKGWARRWKAKGWMRSSRESAVNPDLWERLLTIAEKHNVEFRWVRGHAGNRENERCDQLATQAARGENLPPDTGYKMTAGPTLPFPDVDTETTLDTAKPAVEDMSGERIEATPPTTLTHLDEEGRARMVDVGAKEVTNREAVARGYVSIQPETARLIREGLMKKGDVLTVAQLAGIMGAKKTSELIPLCHPLPLDKVNVDLSLDDEQSRINVTATASTSARTGVEMEALTAVSVAALTLYDMCKSVDRGIRIEGVRLVRKSGGRSGDIDLEDSELVD
jgi:ribonuclease HI